jgi:succinate dehydrogenase / fumarate reductase cytochrome b subunit
MAKDDRPLSPHLQIHRWQLTMVLSITHRATGIVLSAGIPLLLYWIWSLTGGSERYYQAQALFGSGLGRLVLLGVSFSLFYHLCNGIRHLVWDIGRGLDLKSVYAGGWAVVACSVALTLAAWLAAYAVGGGA